MRDSPLHAINATDHTRDTREESSAWLPLRMRTYIGYDFGQKFPNLTNVVPLCNLDRLTSMPLHVRLLGTVAEFPANASGPAVIAADYNGCK